MRRQLYNFYEAESIDVKLKAPPMRIFWGHSIQIDPYKSKFSKNDINMKTVPHFIVAPDKTEQSLLAKISSNQPGRALYKLLDFSGKIVSEILYFLFFARI